MADKRVDELTDIDALADADSFPVRDASATTELKEVTAAQIGTYIDAAGEASSAVATHAALTATHGVSGAIVGTTDTQTLTNKTINSSTNYVEADAVHYNVRNESGGTLTAGTPVYASGYNVGADLIEVSAADASSAATMPCIGIVQADIANAATGVVVSVGVIESLDTSAFTSGDLLYVSETTGALTATPPTAAAVVQPVATVLRDNPSTGSIEVSASPMPTITGFAATLLDDGTAAAARTTLGVDASGTDNSTNVTLAGSLDYLTITGQQITRNAIDLTTDVTGTLPLANGGTNATTAADARTNLGIDAAADARIAAASIDDLADVTVTTPSSGQVLKWNGSAWVNDTDATGGGGGALADITDVTITSVADNEVLAYNSGTSTWINQTAAEAGLATASDLTAHINDTSSAHTVTNIGASTNNVIAGRVTAGAGDLEELTATQVRALINVEDGADVTDTANVTAAGALMDSEVDADIKTLSLPANTTISTFGASLVDDVDAAAARTTLNVDVAGTDNSTDVTLTGTPDYITISGQVITRNAVDLAADVTGTLPLANGGTNATTAAAAKSNLSPLNTVASSGATETLLMGVNDVTMDQNCTFTFPTVGAGHHEFTLILRGAFTPTFPASVDWPSGTPPTYATPTEFSFATVDSGTTWLGVGAPGLA